MAYPCQDPWAVSDHGNVDMLEADLDILDADDEEQSCPPAWCNTSPWWIAHKKQQVFLHGCQHTNHQAKQQAFQALRTHSVVQSFFGLDADLGPCQLADVRSQPSDQDPGYPTQDARGGGPDTGAIIGCLLQHRDLIESCGMIYLIVDNRAPAEVDHWPAFEQWRASRRMLIGPQQERTDIVWIQASQATGLRDVPYYWAGVFVLEAARFLFPQVHFGLIDNDCVPVTLFEVQDLVELARHQFCRTDIVGHPKCPDGEEKFPGMLLFTEAHLEYNAGLVVSLSSPNRPSPVTASSTPLGLANELADCRQQLLAMAVPPECPTEASQGGGLFTPLIGVPMETSLDLAVCWALYGTYMCRQFWPIPSSGRAQEQAAFQWPKRAHPGALSPAGQERTPWLTSWARATFEQGCLSVLPHLEGPCSAISLPGEHLFQASRIRCDRMRPIIFHAFGKAKLDASAQLARLATQGWETLSIALLGTPHHPPAWSVDEWKPIGGCCFSGGPTALTGNSALRFCLLLRWRAITRPTTQLFQTADTSEDSELETPRTPSESNQDLLTRQLLSAATDRDSRESRSCQGKGRTESDARHPRPVDPQSANPPLYVSWQSVTSQLGIPCEHEALAEDLCTMFQTALGILTTEEQRAFHQVQGDAFCSIPRKRAPVESVGPVIQESLLRTCPWVPFWENILWRMAQTYGFWLTTPDSPPPSKVHINCGGLGGGALQSPKGPTFHCTHPRVNGTCVYGPSLAPADRYQGQVNEVAAGHTTSLHELAMLMIHTTDPCEAWAQLGYGSAAVLYRRTQIVLEASRQLPAHRRVPHVAFLSGLWWKLLSMQPARILMCLPFLTRIGNKTIATGLFAPTSFHVEGFSAGSYTGATVLLAVRALFPDCPITAVLGAVAMPKGVMGALLETASPGRCDIHLIHAEEDVLCSWHPSPSDQHTLSHRVRFTLVAEAEKWMGTDKRKYWHWLHCDLPHGRFPLSELKLTHPQVIPIRDRMAAPLRLASWIRFETVMNRKDWKAAIDMLVPNIHLPDAELLDLLRKCVPEQEISSMAEAQALLLRNFRVGGSQPGECALWLTEVTRALFQPIPFREVFVILALFLPQLTFVEGAKLDSQLWYSPAIRSEESTIYVTPMAQGLRGMHEYKIAFSSLSRAAAFVAPEQPVCSWDMLAALPSDHIHIGSQVGRVYRFVLRDGHQVYAALMVLLEFTSQPKKRSKKGSSETKEELATRQSSPRSWTVAYIPTPDTFAPLPTQAELGINVAVQWGLPPSMHRLETITVGIDILSLAEVGTTVSADHLLQMATMPMEHKPTALGIPYQVPVSYQFDGAEELIHSLRALFGLLGSANASRYCPQACGFSRQLCSAANTDSAHILAIALSMVAALQSGRSTLAIAGVFGAGKTRSLTYLLAWFALTTNLRFGVAHKENPAGRAITRLLDTLDLTADQQTLFVRPVGREEAAANTASTEFDQQIFHCAGLIPGARVVITTTGLIWEQKGQSHSALKAHMEGLDVLICEEAQQDMDLKSAFVPAVPRQPFFSPPARRPTTKPGRSC